jgi:hypothetical protein
MSLGYYSMTMKQNMKSPMEEKSTIFNIITNTSQNPTSTPCHLPSYIEGVNKCLLWCIQWKRPNSWPDKWMFHHDYVLSHTALLCEISLPLPLLNTNDATSMIIVWFVLRDFIYLPTTTDLLEMMSFWVTWSHLKQYDDSTERTFWKLFPAMFPHIAETVECMYKVWW